LTSGVIGLPRSTSRGARSLASRHLGRGLVLALGIGALLAVIVASLALGARDIHPGVVVSALLGQEQGSGATIVLELRLPRTVLGLVVGCALGLAGLVMQGLTRNPIADPGILGVSAGSTLAVVLAIAVLGASEPSEYLWFALIGAAIASLVVYALGAAGGGALSPLRLTLAGAVVTAFLMAITSAVLVLDDATLDRFRFWEVGSLAGRDPGVLDAVLPVIVLGGAIALALARALDALALGDEVARGLGQRVLLVRTVGAAAVVLLAGGAVAAAGPIVFVGLMVPHAARVVAGAETRWVAVWCLIIGPLLLISADTLSRLVIRPGEVQVGIITALMGVPALILLVRHRRLSSR
jgi:iron complex transport system permease protein